MFWIQESGRGSGSGKGKGKGKGPADKRSADPSSRSSSKEKQSATPSNKEGARKRPGESTSPPPRRAAAPAPTQLQSLEEIFFCCSCLSNQITSHPTKNPRQGRENQPNDQCVDCRHKKCDTYVVQKAWEPTGSWILGLAAKKFRILPWGLNMPWAYRHFKYLEYEYYPNFLCCKCKRHSHPHFEFPTNDCTEKVTGYLECLRPNNRPNGNKCHHVPCGGCRIQSWSEKPREGPAYTPPQAQRGPPSYVPQPNPNQSASQRHQAAYSYQPPDQTNPSYFASNPQAGPSSARPGSNLSTPVGPSGTIAPQTRADPLYFASNSQASPPHESKISSSSENMLPVNRWYCCDCKRRNNKQWCEPNNGDMCSHWYDAQFEWPAWQCTHRVSDCRTCQDSQNTFR